MSESAQHLHLVNLIIDEVVNLVGETNRCFIMSDAADGYALSPLTEEGYRPDVYYQYQNCLIIGEAKTSDDVARVHSKLQFESYLKKCSLFHGDAVFLAAVPWTEHATIYNLLKKLQKRYPGVCTVRIIDSIGGAI